jgi:hypothetical protein
MDPQVAALQQELQAQQLLIQQQAAQAAAQAAQLTALLQAQQQPVVAPGPFALTPAEAQQNVVDLSTSTGLKLYKQIVTPLATPFDGSADKLMVFLSSVTDKAASSGWNAGLLQISNQDPINPQERNLIQQHRMLTMENVRAHAANYIGQPTRRAQDSRWMYEFLRDSLTESARLRIALQPEAYQVNGINDGPCYLKMILITFYVETNATNFLLRKKLLDLPNKMQQLKYNVPDFNKYVRETVTNLYAGGQTSDDLLVYLFDSYQVVPDHTFRRWYERKKEDYDDMREDITPTALMLAAENKYNQINQAETWEAKSKEEQQILALTAQLKAATDKMAQYSKNKAATKSTPTQDDKAGGEATKANQGKKRLKLKDRYPEWRFMRSGNQTKHTQDGKTYWWCDSMNMWALHEPKDCNALKNRKDKSEQQPSALHIAKALIAVSSANNQETEDEEE